MIFQLSNKRYIDTDKPLDISIPLSASTDNPRAWYVDYPIIEPVIGEGFVGEVAKGGSVNFRNISFNPHGHGTHTECLGHITPEIYSINNCLTKFFFEAQVITVVPVVRWNESANEWDEVIQLSCFDNIDKSIKTEALVIRTSPNTIEKKSKNYSATNPPYIDVACVKLFDELGVKHLLIDLPSVDRENDGGALAVHRAFWKVPEDPQMDKTITEFIFVDNAIEDGAYILNLQVASFENDAAPSRPVLFQIENL